MTENFVDALSASPLTRRQIFFRFLRTGALAGHEMALGRLAARGRIRLARGGLKSNVVTAASSVLIESTFLFAEYGGLEAFSHPRFYEEVGSAVSATTLGLAFGSLATLAAPFVGPAGPVLVVTASLAGALIGALVGEVVVRSVLKSLRPELYQKRDRLRLRNATRQLRIQADRLRALP